MAFHGVVLCLLDVNSGALHLQRFAAQKSNVAVEAASSRILHSKAVKFEEYIYAYFFFTYM